MTNDQRDTYSIQRWSVSGMTNNQTEGYSLQRWSVSGMTDNQTESYSLQRWSVNIDSALGRLKPQAFVAMAVTL